MKKISLYLIALTSILFSTEIKINEKFTFDHLKGKSKNNISYNDI